MKLNSIFTCLLGVTLLLNSCSEDDSTSSLQVKVGNKTIHLKGANLYLAYEDSFDAGARSAAPLFLLRGYFISDGVLDTDENGWTLDNYTNGTYYIGIEIAVPDGSTIGPGEYIPSPDWYAEDGSHSMSYLNMKSGNYPNPDFYMAYNDSETVTPIKVSGGINGNETMTLEFSGKLSFQHYTASTEQWDTTTENCTLLFKGAVNDVRGPL